MKFSLFWQRSIVLAIVFCLSIFTSIVLAMEEAQTYELYFWTKSDAADEVIESDSRVVKLSPHPCGVVVLAEVTKIPSAESDPILEPEVVVEFSPEGEVLQRWYVPVDSVPIGISGNLLLIEIAQQNPLRLWLDNEGNITTKDDRIAINEPERGQCQNLASEFGESDYASCWQYRDLDSNEPRILAFEGVCT